MSLTSRVLWRDAPWLVVGIALLAAAALGLVGIYVGTTTVIPGPASSQVLESNPDERIAKQAGIPPHDDVVILVTHPSLPVESPEFVSASDQLQKILRVAKKVDGTLLFNSVKTIGSSWLADSTFVSENHRTQLMVAESNAPLDTAAEELRELPNLLNAWRATYSDFELHYLSQGVLDNEISAVINDDLDRSLIYTVPITLLILLWTFGSVGAALVPLFVAIVSLIASLGAAALLSTFIRPISATAEQLVVLLVFAVGVDYSLFIVSRMREEVAAGLTYVEAITVARRTAGVAVLWSGLTVALSILGLLLMKDSILTSMALTSFIAVVFTVLGSFVALPGLLRILDRRIEFGRMPKFPAMTSRAGSMLSSSVRRPIPVLVIGLGAISLLSAAAFKLTLGSTVQTALLPKSMQMFEAGNALAESFPAMTGPDFTVILSGASLSTVEDDGALQPFFDALGETGIVRGPFRIDRSGDGTVARYHFTLGTDLNAPESIALVDRMRSDIGPRLISPLGLRVGLGGTLPFATDSRNHYLSRTPFVFVGVLAVSMIFLLIAFRSVVLPIKAIVLNTLSASAAFGILVMLFQMGIIPSLSFGVIESFVPALLFSILFGLSMDYHVFLLSRVREEALSGKTTSEAVETGLRTTSRTTTSAALIMVSVFAVIACLELPIMKQLGIGLAAAVFLDATIIRLALLPAAMVLLGPWNWYLPRCLRWLPSFDAHS